MKFTIKLAEVESIEEISEYWSNDDYIKILEALEMSDTGDSDPDELKELLKMGLSDLEPHEAAAVVLRYKLGEVLSDGQIENISHEMTDATEAKRNSDLSLHYPLFNINRLLYVAFNGLFPSAKATRLGFELSLEEDSADALNKELALKAVSSGLVENNPIIRLFDGQLDGKEPFDDAEHIVWELHKISENNYTLITSDYWIGEGDFTELEFSGAVKLYEGAQE